MQKVLICLLLMTPGALRLSAQTSAQPVDGFAAEVNGEIITVGDVVEYIRPALAQLSRQARGAELIEQQTRLFEDGLNKLIEQRLMIAFFQKLEAELPPTVLRERQDRILRERFDNDEDKLMGVLRRVGKTRKEWEDELRDQMITQSMVQQFVRAKIHVSPREIRERYEQKKSELSGDVEMRLRSISFRPAGGEEQEAQGKKIQTVLEKLKEGEEFSTLAVEFSEGPKAEQGGDEGWVNVSGLPDDLKAPLLSTEAGNTTPLIRTPVQSYIFKVEERRGGGTQSLAEVQDRLAREIEREKYEELYEVWMNGLYQQFQVRKFNPDISAVTGDL